MSFLLAGYLVTLPGKSNSLGKKKLVSVKLPSFFPTLMGICILLSLETVYYLGKE